MKRLMEAASLLGQIPHLGARIDSHEITDFQCPGAAYSKDIGERDFQPLVAGRSTPAILATVSPAFACGRGFSQMTQTRPWAPDNPALLTHFSGRWFYFHLYLQTILPLVGS